MYYFLVITKTTENGQVEGDSCIPLRTLRRTLRTAFTLTLQRVIGYWP